MLVLFVLCALHEFHGDSGAGAGPANPPPPQHVCCCLVLYWHADACSWYPNLRKVSHPKISLGAVTNVKQPFGILGWG